MGRGVDWAVQDVTHLRQWLEEGHKNTRNACNAARLVAGEHQDEAQAAASMCDRRITSAEAAANELAEIETPGQTLSVLRRQTPLEM